jgi:hypothetical protein
VAKLQPTRGDALGSSRNGGLFSVAVRWWTSHWAISRIIQKYRVHLIFGMRLGVIVAITHWLLVGFLLLFLPTSPTYFTTPSLLQKSLAFLRIIQVMPAFVAGMLGSSKLVYGVLVLAQWFIVGFGISFFFRLRHSFFNSTFPFWLLFPLTFVPLILESSGPRYWCGFGLGQPWQWLYYCEGHGADFLSVTAFFEDISVGLAGAILVWQFAKAIFGKRES